MGGKFRMVKHLLPVLLKNRRPDQWYVEPFVGAASVLAKIQGRRLGNDSHYYLIELLKAVQRGWTPPVSVNRKTYRDVRSNTENYAPEMVGFVGFACSFGGKWWGGYAVNKRGCNYAEVGSRGLVKQAESLGGVIFSNGSYLEMQIPPNSIVYCDPPYAGTTKYKDFFDSNIFWQWCRERVADGHKVFVSEYTAPADFDCVLKVPVSVCLNRNVSFSKEEKLFRLKKEDGEVIVLDEQMDKG